RGQQWDIVISDPPSFAPSEKALPRALSAYRSLHGACARVLAPRGIFCAASCSSSERRASITRPSPPSPRVGTSSSPCWPDVRRAALSGSVSPLAPLPRCAGSGPFELVEDLVSTAHVVEPAADGLEVRRQCLTIEPGRAGPDADGGPGSIAHV